MRDDGRNHGRREKKNGSRDRSRSRSRRVKRGGGGKDQRQGSNPKKAARSARERSGVRRPAKKENNNNNAKKKKKQRSASTKSSCSSSEADAASSDSDRGKASCSRHRGSRSHSRSVSRSWSSRRSRSRSSRQEKKEKKKKKGGGHAAATAAAATAKSKSAGSSWYSSSSEEASSAAENGAANATKGSDGHRKDEIIHFDWKRGMTLNERYDIQRLLGDGTFGRVLLAKDRRKDRSVAVKVIRDIKRYMENAKIEAEILTDIRKADPSGSSRCAILYDTFVHDTRHLCLVFEPLGSSLYDFMKKNSFRGFWMQDIQSFAKQCLKCLRFLHDKLQMTHTDLKPENILIQSMEPPRPATFPREKEWLKKSRSSKSRATQYVRPSNTQLKIIDFGNATYESDHHSSVINTRQYRGPEVVLELGWDETSDIWSLGCILMELYSGELLFGTHENLEHLALMEKIVSPLPLKMLRKAKSGVKEKYLTERSADRWELDWPRKASSASSARRVDSELPLAEHVVSKAHAPLVKMVKQMLSEDPSQRLSAAEALKHSFFSADFDD